MDCLDSVRPVGRSFGLGLALRIGQAHHGVAVGVDLELQVDWSQNLGALAHSAVSVTRKCLELGLEGGIRQHRGTVRTAAGLGRRTQNFLKLFVSLISWIEVVQRSTSLECPDASLPAESYALKLETLARTDPPTAALVALIWQVKP